MIFVELDQEEKISCVILLQMRKAAEELMVGRTLTVARVRELNAKDYFYQMLKDNPEMLKIYPGIENELLQGAIDCHIHAFPDFVHRSQDMIQIAIEASKMRHARHRVQRPLEHQRDFRVFNPAPYRRHDRPRRADPSRRSLWRRRHVFRHAARIRPRRIAVSQFQDDLVPDFYFLRLSGAAPAIRTTKACACAAKTAKCCRK